MNNTMHYDAGAGTQIISSPPMNITAIETYTVGQPTTRAERKIAHMAHMDATREYHKARLTNNLIHATVGLSAVVDAAAVVVPSSEPVCRDIIKIGALSSINRISERW